MIELKNYNDTNYGTVGIKAPFQDSNGDNLYVGDVVKIENISELSIICQDENKSFHVMGIFGEDFFGEDSEWKVYKEKSYKSMNVGDEIRGLKFVEEKIKEMTISEIEKELGYSIKIVKD